MALHVNKPSSSNYPTKLTSTPSTPPCSDHQRHKNQTITTIKTKDRQFLVTTTEMETTPTTIYEQFLSGFSDTSDDDDYDDQVILSSPDMSDIELTNETTTATTTKNHEAQRKLIDDKHDKGRK